MNAKKKKINLHFVTTEKSVEALFFKGGYTRHQVEPLEEQWVVNDDPFCTKTEAL